MTDSNQTADSSETTASTAEVVRPVKRKPTPTPFDHPLSFPILIGLFALYFGYDGWFNPKIKSIMFNRWGFVICSIICVWTMRIGLREMRILRERKAKKAAEEAARTTT